MGQTTFLTSRATLPSENLAYNALSTSHSLGGSIDQEYEALRLEFLPPELINTSTEDLIDKEVEDLTPAFSPTEEDESTTTQQEAVKVSSIVIPVIDLPKEEPNSITAVEPPCEEILVENQWAPAISALPVQDQIVMIVDRILSIQTSASIAFTNIKKFNHDLAPTLVNSQAEVKKCKTLMQQAIKLKGGNYGLVQSYKLTLASINPYLKAMSVIKSTVELLNSLLKQIEAQGDVITADVRSGVDDFKKSICTKSIKNDFSKPIDTVQRLIGITNELNLEESIAKIQTLIVQINVRIPQLQASITGPKDPYLHLKNPEDFVSEKLLLEGNLKFLEGYLAKLKSCESARISLISRLEELSKLIYELEQVNYQFLIEEYRAANEPEGVEYNGQDIMTLLV